MEEITNADLKLINNLSSRTYSENRLLSNASEEEKDQLKNIKYKLKEIAKYFAHKYDRIYGPFEISVATGNDIAIRGSKIKRIWSGIFKGAENKQYASQISFVMNPSENCLDVGFYFGRASGHSKNREQRFELEGQLKNLGISLSNTINKDKDFRQKYFELFDFGFTAYSNGLETTSEEWFDDIRENTKNSHIVAKIYPNDFDVIENSKIDFVVSQIIFLMSGISGKNKVTSPIIKPLTSEQRAKKAERLAEIGNKGEIFIFKKEEKKLNLLNIKNPKYPDHVALKSPAYGYDILSLDENENEIFIEVKTTTRPKNDPSSKSFFISTNEYNVYKDNMSKFKLYRVYDIENKPSFEEVDMEKLDKKADGYICNY